MRSFTQLASPLVIAIVMAGCAGSSSLFPSSSHPLKKEHVPSSTSYQAIGWASWYGPGFYGRKTASGEKFQKNVLTCAHRTLPFGTRLEVMNLTNGKTTQVRVNDRGPFVRSKIIDLSYAAAKEIGMLPGGSAKVELRAVPSEPDLAATLPEKPGKPVLSENVPDSSAPASADSDGPPRSIEEIIQGVQEIEK